MNFELFKDGVLIMIIGMGTVYLFLIVMILMMKLSEGLFKVLNKYFPEDVEQDKSKSKKSTNNDEEIALAIACAMAKRGNLC